MVEINQHQITPRPGLIPLWWALRGKTGYRVFGALILDELCQKTDLNASELLRRLRVALQRPMSRQSLTAWRRGDQAVPNDVMIATSVVVGRTLADATLTVVTRVLGDARADRRFAAALRFYYGRGRPEAPAEPPPWIAGAMGDCKRRKGAPRVDHTPLWRDLRGKTAYRVFGALMFDELCGESEINCEELRRRLRQELGRPLSRQTLSAWRRGDRSVPNDVLMATGAIVRRTLAEASLVVATRVISDPDADPDFAAGLRLYHATGLLEMPAGGR